MSVSMARWRTLLILGRVSNLPTIWSNCLAGWWLGGGGNLDRFPFLFAGVSFLYLGGMFLNDAFDADFDQQHRPERPIPSGAISLATVWRWGLGLLALGALFLIGLSPQAGALSLALVVCVIAYNAVHKMIPFAPLLMGICRIFVYLIAASVATNGINGWAVWCGIALGAYVMGLSFLARHESSPGSIEFWPLILLGTPIVLAVIMNAGEFRRPALLASLILGLWIIRCLRPALASAPRQLGRAVAGLIAGIALVDLLAVVDAPLLVRGIFLTLFLLSLLLQRAVPAT